jgi:hypothetical protein
VDVAAIYRVVLGADKQPDGWQPALTAAARLRVLVVPTGPGESAAVQDPR